MKKRILSILLCLSMAVALLPAVSLPAAAADTVTYIDAEGNPQSASATPVTSGLTAWNSGWYYVSGAVSLASVTVNGSVHLILTDNSKLTVTGSESSAGICVEDSNSLTIYGQADGSGTLTAIGGNDEPGIWWDGSRGGGAAIGGGAESIGGTITINGGIVKATGYYDAGIGGGYKGSGGTVTINGGTVTATSDNGAGIGGGGAGFHDHIGGNGGTIIINGGIVNANGYYGAGIGGGDDGSGGTITINGGTVTATSGFGAGVGGGIGGNGGTITISGGTVMAIGGVLGAGIGGGSGGDGGTVNISGGSVNAITGNTIFAQAIGHGHGSHSSGTLQNGSGSDVSLTTVTLSDVTTKTAVTSLTTSLTGYTYGIKDMQTDEGGMLYLYLPSGTTVTGALATSGSFSGSVSSGTPGTLNMNDGLASMTLSGSSVQENVPVGTPVGTLSTSVSGSVSGSFTYQLVSGEGDTDNGSFSISGDSLQLAASPDYETKSSYSIRVRTTNGDGLYLEQPFIITITDVNDAPVISASTGKTATAAGEAVYADSFVTVSDVDSPTLASATVSITNNFQSGQDILSFANTDSSAYGNITGSYNASNGVLTLSSSDGTATLAQWQAALRTVEFNYESGDGTPVTLERTIEFKVNDGDLDSAPSTKTIASVTLVLSTTPGNGPEAVLVSGNAAITFSQAMNTFAGTVSLTPEEGETVSLTGGTWSNGNTTYTAAYSGLSYNAAYTLTVLGFEDAAGNVMSAYSHHITTELEPLTPTVSPDNLTIVKGGTAGFSVALGQGTAAATSASISAANNTIASVDSSLLTENGTVSVSGLAVGTTDITIAFNDTSHAERTISVTVVPVPPVWPIDSSLAISNVTDADATLTWTAASDITAVTGYQIYRDGALIGTVDGSTLTYSVTGLSASTAYSFQVQAGNDDGMWTTDGPTVNVTTSAPSTSSDEISTTANISGNDGTSQMVSVTASGNSAFAAISTAQSDILADCGLLTLTMPTIENTKNYGIKLPSGSLSKDAGGTLTMNTNLGSMTVPSNMLSSLSGAADKTAQIAISQGSASSLPRDVQNEIGNRPILQLAVFLNGIATEWSNSDAPVTVSIPYTPTAEELEHPESIIVWYLDGKGRAVCVPSGHYDAKTGAVVFTTTHFSQYAVGYHCVSFSDVASSEWYADSVSYLSSRSVISGTNGEFRPEAAITRAQFVTILSRLSGDDLSGQTASLFSDVSASDWFFQAAQWANRISISAGSGGNFNPNEGITREQMAVMLYRYAKYKGYDVSIGEDTNILSYNDSLSISDYAYAALQWACGAEILQGDDAGNLNPNGCATRTQAAVILQRFIENKAD